MGVLRGARPTTSRRDHPPAGISIPSDCVPLPGYVAARVGDTCEACGVSESDLVRTDVDVHGTGTRRWDREHRELEIPRDSDFLSSADAFLTRTAKVALAFRMSRSMSRSGRPEGGGPGVALPARNHPGQMFRRATFGRAVAAIVLCGALLTGCGSDDESRGIQAADSYIVVVEWILAEPEFAPDPTLDELQPVFVESLGPGEIDLDVQVQIVRHFELVVDIRFIDTRAEALDESEGEAPVRDNGLLLGLGPIPVQGPIEIRGEVYRTSDLVAGYRFRVARRGETMVLIEPPERVEPEGLVVGL